jgi:hypothetical protein
VQAGLYDLFHLATITQGIILNQVLSKYREEYMKIIERFYRSNLVIILIAVLFFSSVSSVQAATTGSQIKVAACSAIKVIIKGKNQSGISIA